MTKSLQDTQQRKVTPSDAVVNELGSGLNALIQKTLHVTQSDDSGAVSQAKQALVSGTLDTPEAITAAAEKLLAFGI